MTVWTFPYVCLPCRRAVKSTVQQNSIRQQYVLCPNCRGEMVMLGRGFAAPRKKDTAGWKKLEWMIQNGYRGFARPTRPQMNLSQTQESLAAQARRESKIARLSREDAALLERRRAAKYKLSHSATAKKRLKADVKRQEEYQTAALEEAFVKAQAGLSNRS